MRSVFVAVFLLFLCVAPVSAQTMQISGLNDLSLGSWSGSGDLFNSDPLCVYNLGVESYQITATGSGAANAFLLSGTGGTVAYEVQFKGSTGAYDNITSGSARTFGDADIGSQNCGGSTNADVKVIAKQNALSSAPAGSYSGTLTLLLETN